MTDCTFIIFGITGDLSKRKLLPGIYQVIKQNKIDNFVIIGAGLEEKSISQILESAKEFINDMDQEIWSKLLKSSFYIKNNVEEKSDFKNLVDLILEKEKLFKLSGNRLAYCATPSVVFGDITKHLVEFGILKKRESADRSWYRIAYEKPFGHNLQSAEQLNKEILSLLDESQIYRVDHYLAKEVVENILYIRFTNYIFETLWNSNHIESVQIHLNEDDGVGSRGSYYDNYGALKDVVQNHMLQLLALVGMNEPEKLIGDNIRNYKANILKSVKVDSGFLGQYEGYKNENKISPNSSTDTFAVLKLFINDQRWKGVPFYLKTGKALKEKSTKIHIQFKKVSCKLTKESCPIEGNYLTLTVFPLAGFSFEINSKKPGEKDSVVPVKMDFCYECLFEPSTPEAYEHILRDIISGDQAVSVRFDEIEYSWKIIDEVKELKLPLYIYGKGTRGPEKELLEFSKKNNFIWRD